MPLLIDSKDVAKVIEIAVGQLKRRGVKTETIRNALLYAGTVIAVTDSGWAPDVVASYVRDYALGLK